MRKPHAFPLLVTLGVCLSLLSGPGVAYADDVLDGNSQNSDPGPKGNSSPDGTISASASGVVFDLSKNGSGASVGAITSTTSWAPPACWYAPKYTPAQLQAYLEPIWEAGSTGYE